MFNPEQQWLSPDDKKSINFSIQEGHLEWILTHIGFADSLAHIAGWDILDLGCGSPDSTSADYGVKERFAAWFPRVCATYGARVTGIDLYRQDPQDIEVYTHISADLNDLLSGYRLVELFPGMKFHLIHTNAALAPASTYSKTVGDSGKNLIDEVKKHIHNLKEQATQLLLPNGVLAINNEVYAFEPRSGLRKLGIPNFTSQP
jgi:hypothetical protein